MSAPEGATKAEPRPDSRVTVDGDGGDVAARPDDDAVLSEDLSQYEGLGKALAASSASTAALERERASLKRRIDRFQRTMAALREALLDTQADETTARVTAEADESKARDALTVASTSRPVPSQKEQPIHASRSPSTSPIAGRNAARSVTPPRPLCVENFDAKTPGAGITPRRQAVAPTTPQALASPPPEPKPLPPTIAAMLRNNNKNNSNNTNTNTAATAPAARQHVDPPQLQLTPARQVHTSKSDLRTPTRSVFPSATLDNVKSPALVFRRQPGVSQAADAVAASPSPPPSSPKCETAAQTEEVPVPEVVPSVVVDAPSDVSSTDGRGTELCWVDFETGFGAHRRVADPTAGDVAVIGRRDGADAGEEHITADWKATVVGWYVSSTEGDEWEKLHTATEAGPVPTILPLTSSHIGRFIGASVRFAPPPAKKANASSPPTAAAAAAGDESGVPLLHFAQSANPVGAFDPSVAADAFELVDMLRLKESSISLALVAHPSDDDDDDDDDLRHRSRSFDFSATSAVLGPVSGRLVDPATDEFEADADDAADGYSCLVLECSEGPAAYEQPAVILTAVEGWQVVLRGGRESPNVPVHEHEPAAEAPRWTFETSLVASRGLGAMGVRLRGWRGTFTKFAIEPSAVVLTPLIPGTALQALAARAARVAERGGDASATRWAHAYPEDQDDAGAAAASAAAVVSSALVLLCSDPGRESDASGASFSAAHQHTDAVREVIGLFSGERIPLAADRSATFALFGIGVEPHHARCTVMLGSFAAAPADASRPALFKRQSRRSVATALVRWHFTGPDGSIATAADFSCACVLTDVADGLPCLLTRRGDSASVTAAVGGARVLLGAYRLGKRRSVQVAVHVSEPTATAHKGSVLVELLDTDSESCLRLCPIALISATADPPVSAMGEEGSAAVAAKPWTVLLLADAVGHALRTV